MKAALLFTRAALCSASVALACLFPLASARALSADEARIIAIEAYVYFYPLVSMDVTRRQLTNVEAPQGLAAPTNVFANIRTYPTADMRAVVRPNFDTLYSSAWVDVSKEPVVISVPDTNGRYYLLPMLDMWTDVFASPGWRTSGTKAQTLLVASPTWRPDLRARFDELKLPQGTTRIDAPTPTFWIVGRTKTDGPPDYDAVHKIQDGLKITPLSQWGKNAGAVKGTVDPSVDMKTPPKIQVDTMTGARFFAYAAEVLKTQPPHVTDQPIVARMKQIGIEPGRSFDPEKADPVVRTALEHAPAEGQKVMEFKFLTLARVVNGWSLNTDTMGVYGNYYLKRAIVAQIGLGANLPEDAIYPVNLHDNTGKPLTGENRYVLHFEKSELPPTAAFWSITLYDKDGFQVANPLNRFAVSSWNPLTFNADGSLDLYFQNQEPELAKRSNWLPAPKGSFNLTMRIYAPSYRALIGRWAPPPVVNLDAAPAPSGH